MKKTTILGLFFLLLATLTNAQVDLTDNEIEIWLLDTNITVVGVNNLINLSATTIIENTTIGTTEVNFTNVSRHISPLTEPTGIIPVSSYNNDSMSVTGWFRRPLNVPTVGGIGIFKIHNSTQDFINLFYPFSSNTLTLNNDSATYNVSASSAVGVDTWYFIAYTKNGSTSSLSINNEQNFTNPNALNNALQGEINITIGDYLAAGAGVHLSCFRYYNETLSGSQTSLLYNNGEHTCDTIESLTSALFNLTEFATCSDPTSLGNVSLNFTIFNETTRNTHIVSDVDAEFTIHNPSRTLSFNRNFSLSGSASYTFCLAPQDSIVEVDSVIKYTTDGGFTHRSYLQNQTLTNNTLFVEGGNYGTTTGISNLKITLRNKNTFLPITNIFGTLQRKYVDVGFKTVQMDRSGDFGLNFFNIIEESEDYRLIFKNENNIVLKTTDSLKFICVTAECDLTILISPTGDAAATISLGVGFTYDNDTKVLDLSWSDPDGLTDEVTIIVTKETFSTTTDVCRTIIPGGTGTFTCNATNFTGPFVLSVTRASSPDIFDFTVIFGQEVNDLQGLLGGSRVAAFYSGLIIVVVGTAGVTAGVTGAALAIFLGLLIALLLNILSTMTITIVVTLAIATAIIVVKLKRQASP